ncbi:hypothetical protein SMA90_30600, partial [Escherichia coli]
KLTVDIDGNVFIAAHLTVGGGLATNEIRPMEGGDLVFNLANVIPDPIRDQGETDPDFRQDDGGGAVQDDGNETGDNAGFGKLLVKGINNEMVASIDA